jgi:putative addiction module component (TIGR02574 family)
VDCSSLPGAPGPGRIYAVAARPDDAILNLPVDERLALVDSIWESIRENADAVPVDEETTDEMQRRLELHRHDPEAADDLDVILARLRASD